MKWFSFIIILFIATFFEASHLLDVFAIGDWTIRPSLLITLLVFYAFSSRPREAIIYSFIIGFIADMTGRQMGPHMICFGIVGLLLSQSNQVLFARRAIFKASIVFVAYVVAEAFSYWLTLLNKGNESQINFYAILFSTAMYSAVISPLIWSLLSAVSGLAAPGKAHQRMYD